MPTRVLSIRNLDIVPFRDYVRRQIETGLSEFVRSHHLELDFSGRRNGLYVLRFEANYEWSRFNRDRCWYRPAIFGVTGNVNVQAIQRRNYCLDVGNCSTCEPVMRQVPQELGKSISITALHEIAHLFGLIHGGPDGSGHTADPGNFMFVNSLHQNYVPFVRDYNRSIRYTIRRGDSLWRISDRIGFAPPVGTWRTLYEFRGKDGRCNRDLLRSTNPNLIYPGEEIWIPDIRNRLLYMRRLELQDKRFTTEQIAVMRRCLTDGSTIFGVE